MIQKCKKTMDIYICDSTRMKENQKVMENPFLYLLFWLPELCLPAGSSSFPCSGSQHTPPVSSQQNVLGF